ncbi:hypothetical protein EV650_1494 [Kribbella kalugense]|uniref:Uncharacterized protein n=1 Tax=Kribbella kalugense TaxID=2512221 RepID=A0A4R7ZX00_9ACTN|nr:hypothetical protein EV650_1494 [Kribbella kalugense]
MSRDYEPGSRCHEDLFHTYESVFRCHLTTLPTLFDAIRSRDRTHAPSREPLLARPRVRRSRSAQRLAARLMIAANSIYQVCLVRSAFFTALGCLAAYLGPVSHSFTSLRWSGERGLVSVDLSAVRELGVRAYRHDARAGAGVYRAISRLRRSSTRSGTCSRGSRSGAVSGRLSPGVSGPSSSRTGLRWSRTVVGFRRWQRRVSAVSGVLAIVVVISRLPTITARRQITCSTG